MLIQKLRLKRGWSQQQLAAASGLSSRTIQRIEAGYPASTESLKSLAAVFEVDFSTLNPEQDMTSQTIESIERDEAEVFKEVRRLRHFYLGLIRYFVVVAVLAAAYVFVSPHKWMLWVIGISTLVMLMRAFRVFSTKWFLGPQWERQEVEKRLGRSL